MTADKGDDDRVAEGPADYALESAEKTTLDDRIRFLLQRSGKAEISRIAGVSETQIYRYTTGENEPRASVLRRLAEGTGVTPGWLLSGSGRIFEDDHDYLQDLDEVLLTRILATLDELTPAPQAEEDYRIRAEVAVAAYRHALQTIPDPERRSEMVGGIIRTLAPLMNKKP